MEIYKEKAGMISKDAIWVCLHKNYMYTGATILLLIKDIIKNWNKDSNMLY